MVLKILVFIQGFLPYLDLAEQEPIGCIIDTPGQISGMDFMFLCHTFPYVFLNF